MTQFTGAAMLRFCLISALLLAGSPAMADPAGVSFAQRLFGGGASGSKMYGCFVRVYDASHLREHPQQKVERLKLLVTAEKIPEDAALNYSFRLGIHFRDKPGAFDSSGDCGHLRANENPKGSGEIGCAVDCDGGGLSVGLADKQDAVMMHLPGQVRIWRKNQPDEEASHTLRGGLDDKLFRLERASLAQCQELVTDRKELAAMRRK